MRHDYTTDFDELNHILHILILDCIYHIFLYSSECNQTGGSLEMFLYSCIQHRHIERLKNTCQLGFQGLFIFLSGWLSVSRDLVPFPRQLLRTCNPVHQGLLFKGLLLT